MDTVAGQSVAHQTLPVAHSNSISNSAHGSSGGVIHPTVVHRQSHIAHSTVDSSSTQSTIVHRPSGISSHTASTPLSVPSTASSPLVASHHTGPSVHPPPATHTAAPSQPVSKADLNQPAASTSSTHPHTRNQHSQHLGQTAVEAVKETDHTQHNSDGSANRVKRKAPVRKESVEEEEVELTCADLLESLFFCCATSRPQAKVATVPRLPLPPAQSTMQR